MHIISNWMGDMLPLACLLLRPPTILPKPPVAILGMVGVAIDDAPARPVPAPAAQVARFLSGGGVAPSLPLGPAGGLPRLLGGLALGLAEGVSVEVDGIAVGGFGALVVDGIAVILAVRYDRLFLFRCIILLRQTNIQPPDLVAHRL